ncbi:MAG: hypothetical protein KGQ95_09675 [Acidobacteria bacterium]|nr:hypothetical protein [Acidobacteriota bacterium]
MNTPSPALAVSLVALAVALGGTGYAVTQLPSNSVGAAGRPTPLATTDPVTLAATGAYPGIVGWNSLGAGCWLFLA